MTTKTRKSVEHQWQPLKGRRTVSLNTRFGYQSIINYRSRKNPLLWPPASEVFQISLMWGNTMISSDIVREVFGPVFTVTLECWVQIIFILNILPVAVTVCGVALVMRCHLCSTIQTAWVTIIGRPQGEGVLEDRGTPENLLFRGFNFTLSNLNVGPYPLCQRRSVWGRGGIWRVRETSFVGTLNAHWQGWWCTKLKCHDLCSLSHLGKMSILTHISRQ